MDLGLNINAGNKTILQDEIKTSFSDKNIKFVVNDDRPTSYSEGIQSKVDLKPLDDRKTKIQSEAKKMRETASKRSKTILAVGLVAGAIAGIVGGALALAGIATMIPFIIAGISVFVGIFGSIASLPEKEQRYEVRLTVEYAKEALAGKAEEKAKALRYLSKIIEDTAKAENESFYSDDRNNLLRLAVKDILDKNKEAIRDCLINGSKNVKSGAINLLSKAISRKDLSKEAKEIIKFFNKDNATIFVKNCLSGSDNEVIINTFNLLGNLIVSEDSSMKNVVTSALTENKEGIYDCLINGSKDVKSSVANLLSKAEIKDLNENKEIIQGLLNDKKLTDIQGDKLLIIKIMLYSKDSNVSKTGINVLTNIINESKDTAKKLFADGILNQGTVKKMIHDESTRNEMLDLLKLMSKDENLKDVVFDLVGSDIADKLPKLNPQSTTEEKTEGKNKIIEEIKNLKLGPPEKLNAGDIVYANNQVFGKNLTVLEQSKENIQKANKIKKFLQKSAIVNDSKDKFSKNDGLHDEHRKILESFLKSKGSDPNIETNKIDSEKVAKQSITDLSRNLFSIKKNGSKYIIKSQDKVGEELGKLLRNESTEDAFAKIIRDKMKVDINILCSFPGQSSQGNVSLLLVKDGFAASNMSSSYDIVINDNGTIDITARDIYRIVDIGKPASVLPIAIEEKTVFRLNKQEKDEYVPITPLEAQVNVYDADVLVDENGDLCALKTHENVTSIDWKNDEVKK